MFVTGLRVTVARPDAGRMCALEDEAYNDAHLIICVEKLKKTLALVRAQRDEHIHEEDQVATLKQAIAAFQRQLEDKMRSLDCMKPHEEHWKTEKLLTDQVARLLTIPLGAEYIKATWWLSLPAYPPYVGTREVKLCEVQQTLMDCSTHLSKTSIGELSEFLRLGDRLLEVWTMRYEKLARLFHEAARAGSECGVDWPEFKNVENVSAALANWVSREAFKHHEGLNPCVAQVMALLLPLQQQERRFLNALGALTCNRDLFIQTVRKVEDLLNQCNSSALKMSALDEQRMALAKATATVGTVNEINILRDQIAALKCQVASIDHFLARRHDLFDEEIHAIECQIKSVMQNRCEGNDSVDVCLPDAPLLLAGAPCGYSLELELSFFEPGLAIEYSIEMFAHHEQQITSLKAQLTELKARQAVWVSATTRFSSLTGSDLDTMRNSLNDMEKAELETALKKAGGLMNPAVFHAMVCYWTRVICALESQLSSFIREQTEGVIERTYNSNQVVFPDFNWSRQGLYTIRFTDVTHGRSYYQTINLVVIPDQKAQSRTFDDWMKQAHQTICELAATTAAAKAAANPVAAPAAAPGSAILAKIRPSKPLEQLFESPQHFVEAMLKHTDASVQSLARSLQGHRLRAAQAVASKMSLKNSQQAVEESLRMEEWDSFLDTPALFVAGADGCQYPDPHSDSIPMVETSERQRAVWNARLARVVQRRLWSEFPDFSLILFTQCNYRELMCAIEDRAMSMRWTIEELSEFGQTTLGPSAVAVTANDWLVDRLRALRDVIQLHSAVQSTRDHGLLLVAWYGRVSDRYADLMATIANLDAWIDCATACKTGSGPVPIDVARQESEVNKLKTAVDQAMAALKHELTLFVLPRCEPSRQDVAALLFRIEAGPSTLRNNWHHLVDAHLMLTHLFNIEAPWKTVFGTCQPLELMETLIVLCAEGVQTQDVCGALEQLEMLLRDLYVPALRDWLRFSIDDEIRLFSHSQCVTDLLGEDMALRGDVVELANRMNQLLKRAREAEHMASTYRFLLEPEGGALGQLKTAAQEALPRQPVFAEVERLVNILYAHYEDLDMREWIRRVRQQGMAPVDSVTCLMGQFADRWESDPLTDSGPLLMLSNAPLLKPGYAGWLKEMAKWLLSVMKTVEGTRGTIKALYSSQLVASAPDATTPTMASLMQDYRDLIRTSTVKTACSLTDLMTAYFAAEYHVASLFRELAMEIGRLARLMLDDLASLHLCLGFSTCPPFQNTWSTKEAADFDQLVCALHEKLPSPAECSEMFAFVRDEYAHRRARRIELDRHIATAIEAENPMLNDPAPNEDRSHCEQANSAERRHLIEVAEPVFRLRRSEEALEALGHYRILIDFLEKHFVCIPEPAEACKIGAAYVPAINERPTARLTATSIRMQRQTGQRWYGTQAELTWLMLGVRAWEMMVELQNYVLELAYSSPGCLTTPTEWPERNVAIKARNVEIARRNLTTLGMTEAVHAALGEIYQHYTEIAHFLHNECYREQFVIESARLTTVPQWAYQAVIQLFPESRGDLITLKKSIYVPARSHLLPVVEANEIDDIRTEDVARHTKFMSLPLLMNPASLRPEHAPMNDLLLSRAFYRFVASADSMRLPRHLVINLMRYHSCREGAELILNANSALTSRVIVGGDSTTSTPHGYIEDLGRLFYVAYANNVDAFIQWTQNAEMLFGPSPDKILMDPSRRYSAFIRGEEYVAAYNASVEETVEYIGARTLLDPATLGTFSSDQKVTSQVWGELRASLWWLALTRTIEARGHNIAEWFVVKFVPTFVALDMYLQPDHLLFAEAHPITDLPEPEVPLSTLVIWLVESTKVIEDGDIALDTIVDTIAVIKNTQVQLATNVPFTADDGSSPLGSLLAPNHGLIAATVRNLYVQMGVN